MPRGGIARFYGTAKIYRSGPVYDEVWRGLVQPEKDRDPEQEGLAVLIAVERAEDLRRADETLSTLEGGTLGPRAVGEGIARCRPSRDFGLRPQPPSQREKKDQLRNCSSARAPRG